MKPRTLALTVTAIAVLVSLAGGAFPALAASKPSCSAGRTLAAGKSARVFRTKSRRVYGCSLSTKKVSFLGVISDKGVDTSVLAVNGPRVAYVRTFPHDSGSEQTVLVRDLKRRKLLFFENATPGGFENQQVTDIVLTRSGTVAWISEATTATPLPLPARRERFVLARKPGQALLPLAIGLDIARGSLALAANRLYWTQGGVAKAAPLP